MTNAQRFCIISCAALSFTMIWQAADISEHHQMGYKQSVIRAIQSKSPAQKMHVEPAFNPQKISFSLYLPPLPAKELRK